jgi:hypothetical protein
MLKLGQTPGMKAMINMAGFDATALHLAVEDGHWEVLRLFLASGVDPCVKMWDGSTALRIAANHLEPHGPNDYKGLVKGREECLKLLLVRAPESAGIAITWTAHRFIEPWQQWPLRNSAVFFQVCAPLGREIGKSCYVATVELEYYYDRAEWQKDKSKEEYIHGAGAPSFRSLTLKESK